ncbi:MAG: rod shape-determining protein RodA [Acidobacteriota bacterium]
MDYRRLVKYSGLLYGLALVGLVGVLLFGNVINGSKSWISLFGVNLQPSEMCKVVLLLFVVKLVHEETEEYLSTRRLVQVLAGAGALVVLVVLQRDVGTALMYFPIVGAVLWVAGIPRRILVTLVLLVVAAAPVVWWGLRDYQRERVLVTLNPDRDPQGVGYQVRQAKIAIGSGGFWGKGIGQGTQSQLGFVPESHTDFIFAVLAEETGFLGGATILVLYLWLILGVLETGRQARDREGILLAAGIGGYLLAHVVVNVGMALGFLPPIGIPLPLLSYGGSSLLTTFAALGLAAAVSVRRYLYA